jgi:hypothetical protein
MLIGALGVLADTAVTQASAVIALRRANPRYEARRLYREAFVIGPTISRPRSTRWFSPTRAQPCRYCSS